MKLLRRHLRRLTGEQAAFVPEPALEDVYRHLFRRDLAAMDVADGFLPTGPVVNYGLLHLILKIATDIRPANVLDVGAGQATLLWDLLVRSGHVDRITTIEHDQIVADEIGFHVAHRPIIVPLHLLRLGAVLTRTYDWQRVIGRGPFDVVICDGPPSTPRFSRYGIIALLDQSLPADFLLVIDDAERAGEQDTIVAIHQRFKQMGRPYEAGIMRAMHTQAIFATGAYRGICTP